MGGLEGSLVSMSEGALQSGDFPFSRACQALGSLCSLSLKVKVRRPLIIWGVGY